MIGVAKVAAGEGHVELAERPERAPGPGEVALDVHAAGICGTDLHIWLGEYPSVPPVTMGHEVCGTVADLGEGVDPGWAGARVAVETFYTTCGECAHCRAGKLSVCEHRRSIGTHVDGGFAPRLVLPVRNLHRVPDSLPDAAAALSEPLAGSLGFATSVAGRDEAPAADVVVECSGAEPAIADALRAARRRGRIVQMGLRGADVTIPYDLICLHELTVSAGFACNPASWRRAMALLADGAVELAPLVTEIVPLADWRRAFEASRAGEGVKYVLDPR